MRAGSLSAPGTKDLSGKRETLHSPPFPKQRGIKGPAWMWAGGRKERQGWPCRELCTAGLDSVTAVFKIWKMLWIMEMVAFWKKREAAETLAKPGKLVSGLDPKWARAGPEASTRNMPRALFTRHVRATRTNPELLGVRPCPSWFLPSL